MIYFILPLHLISSFPIQVVSDEQNNFPLPDFSLKPSKHMYSIVSAYRAFVFNVTAFGIEGGSTHSIA